MANSTYNKQVVMLVAEGIKNVSPKQQSVEYVAGRKQ